MGGVRKLSEEERCPGHAKLLGRMSVSLALEWRRYRQLAYRTIQELERDVWFAVDRVYMSYINDRSLLVYDFSRSENLSAYHLLYFWANT